MITTRFSGHLVSRVVLALLAASFVAVSGAQAQLTKIFVASFGNDGNDGSRGSPKRNFQAAHNAVAAGGQIVVLDTAGYGQLTITKSLAITVPPGVNGFVTVTGTNDAITVAAGEGSVVSLRGLIIEGGGSRQSTGSGPGFGIHVTSVGWLTVEDCTIRNFLDALPFIPTNTGATLAMYNTSVRNCRYGIDAQGPAGSGSTRSVIVGCRLENLGDAIYASGPDRAYVTIEDSVVSHAYTVIHLYKEGNVQVSNCRFNYIANALIVKDGPPLNNIVSSFGNNTLSFAFGTFDDTRSLE